MEYPPLIRILHFFLDNPYSEVYLRELAKKIRLSPFATKKYADMLVKEDLIREERKANMRYFKANMNSLFLRYLKIAANLQRIEKSKIIPYVKEHIQNVSSIILFGSTARGENDKKSDIDLLIVGTHKYMDLTEFEKKTNQKITTHIYSWSEWNKNATQNKAFYYEVIKDGISLYGELPIVK